MVANRTSLSAQSLKSVYLTQASLLMLSSSPTTSVQLTATRLGIEQRSSDKSSALGNHKAPVTHTHLCEACGNLVTTTRVISLKQYHATKQKINNGSKPKRKRAVFRQCPRCRRTTTVTLPHTPAVVAALPAPNLKLTKAVIETDSKVSSKKRAKARKDRSDLKAMLDASKQDNKVAPAFNLMDFMRA